jgi:HEAT repeat protein
MLGEYAAQAVPTLAKVMESGHDAGVSECAAEALGKLGKRAARAVATPAKVIVRDRYADVRKCAAVALGQLGKRAAQAFPTLAKVLGLDQDFVVRACAGKALGLVKTSLDGAGDCPSGEAQRLVWQRVMPSSSLVERPSTLQKQVQTLR